MPTTKKTEHESFAAAIAAAQADMSNAAKNANNPHFKKDYANLSAVRDVVVPAFNKHGVAILQPIEGQDGFCTVRTLLMWKEQTLETGNCTLSIGNSRNAAQAVGAVVTYLRRYQLASVGGIAQEDDDAQSYQAPKPQQRQQRLQERKPVLQGPPAVDGPGCPECGSVLKVNINYRAWLKTLSNEERKQQKQKPALCCSDWKNCDFKAWTTDEAQQAIEAINAQKPFDDGLNDVK